MSKSIKYKKKVHYTKNAKLNPRQKKEVKQLVKGNIELKSVDSIGVANTSSTTPTVAKWLSLAQGTGNSARIGNEVTISRIHLRYNMVAGDATNVIRVILFQWLDDDTLVNPTYDDILYRGGTLEPYTNCLYNYDKRHQYRILYDKRHVVDNDNPNAQQNFGEDKYCKGFVKKMQFDSSLLTGKGMIYGLYVSDSGTVAHPAIDIHVRMYYRDA